MVSRTFTCAILTLLALIAGGLPARGDDHVEHILNGRLWVEGDELKIENTAAGGAKTTNTISLIPVKKGERFFHWTRKENVDRWRAQGHIDGGEMAFLSKPTGERQVYGPGFYVSRDPLDSSGYGPSGIVSEMKEDFYLLGQRISSEDPAFSKALQDKLRAVKIFGNRAKGTWNVFFDEKTTTAVRPLDATIILDHYASAKPGAMADLSWLETLAGKVKLVPHPLIEASNPELQKSLLGQSLSAREEQTLVNQLKHRETLRPILAERIPPARLQKYLIADAPSSGPARILALLDIDASTGGLRPSDELRKLHPQIADLVEGKELSPDDRAVLWSDFANDAPDGYASPLKYELSDRNLDIETPFLRKLKNEFAPELRDGFRRAVSQQQNPSSLITLARSWGVRLSDLLPGERDPGGTPLTRGPLVPIPAQLAKLDDYGRNLADSFAIVDHFDLARAIANGNPEPWKLYDEPVKAPLLDRWRKALAKVNHGGDIFATYEVLFGKKKDFRGKRVVAGGDVKIPGDPFGYARMTLEQVAALRSNPLLTVYEKEDPYPQHRGKRTSLVRYEYPSAATFETFKSQLSHSLLRNLESAKKAGELASEGSETFQKLTREILRELWQQTYYAGKAISNYRARITIHPFEDYNGRIARLLYHGDSGGKPLVMPQWDLDLLTRPEALQVHQEKGHTTYAKILNALTDRKAEAPGFPRYFDSPEIFETLLDLPPETNASRRAKHLAALKNFLRSPEAGSMIAQKEITQLQWKLWDLEGAEWEKLPESERVSVLKKWMSNGFVPEFSDDRLFRRVLEESKRLARGKDEARVARWWLQIGAGLDPVHAATLADHLRSLPAGLAKAFRDEWVRGENVLNLPFRAEERAAWEAELKKILDGAPDEGISAEKRARHFIQQELYNPANPKKPYAGFLRVGHQNHPDFNKALLELLNSPSHPKLAEAIEATMKLPPAVLREFAPSLTSTLLSRREASAGVQAALKQAMLQEGHPVAEAAFQNFAKGLNSYEDYLADPRIRKRFLAQKYVLPPSALIDEHLSVAAITPERAKAALQSFIDRKEWNSFLRLAQLTAQPRLVDPSASPAQKALLKQILSGLPKAEKGLGEDRAVAFEIIREKINPPDPARGEKLQGALRKAIREKNAFLPQDIYALGETSPGQVHVANLMDTIMPLGNEETAELLRKGPIEILSRREWQPAWDDGLKALLKRASLEDQVAITTKLSYGFSWREVAASAYNQLGTEAQARLIESGRMQLTTVFSAFLSDEEQLRSAAAKIFYPGQTDPSGDIDLARRLLEKGPAGLMERPLPTEWDRTIGHFLTSGVDRKVKFDVRDALVSEIFKSGSLVPRSHEEVKALPAMKLLLEDWGQEENKVGAYFAQKMEAVLKSDLPLEWRKEAMGEFRKIGAFSQPFRSAMDSEKLLKLYEKYRDEDLLFLLVAKAERDLRSNLSREVFAEGLKSQEASIRLSSSRNLRLILEDAAASEADRTFVRKAVQDTLDAGYLRNWSAFQKQDTYRLLQELGTAAGFDVNAYAEKLSAGMIPLKAGPQGITCSYQFNRIKLK